MSDLTTQYGIITTTLRTSVGARSSTIGHPASKIIFARIQWSIEERMWVHYLTALVSLVGKLMDGF